MPLENTYTLDTQHSSPGFPRLAGVGCFNYIAKKSSHRGGQYRDLVRSYAGQKTPTRRKGIQIMRIVTVLAVALLGTSSLAVAQHAQAAIQHYQLNIPHESLDMALNDLAQQTGLQVGRFSGRIDGSAMVGPVRGDQTPEQALKTLLYKTGLAYKIVGDTTFAVYNPKDPTLSTTALTITDSSSRLSQGDPSQLSPQSSVPSPRTSGPVQNSDAESSSNKDSTPDARLSEIVVTAQKRTERLIDVPMSVTALSGESLQQAGAVNFGDYIASVPGVAFASTGFLDRIYIRGLADTISSQAASATGIYLDEANLTESTANIGDVGTFDIQRVEVLRGPQGTLYGDSSMGGTVRVITNKPDLNRFDAVVDETLSGTHHGGLNDTSNLMLNAPIIDGVLGMRFVAGYSHTAGFIDNVATGQDRINPDRTERVRFLTEYDPSDQLHLLLSFNYVENRQDFGPYEDVNLPPYDVSRQYAEFSDYRMKVYGLTVNYDFGWANLTSATNYLDKFNEYVKDLTPVFLPLIQSAIPTTLPADTGVGLTFVFPNREVTQEIRLNSTNQGQLHWLVGAYYSLFKPPVGVQQFLTNSALTQDINLYTGDEYLRRDQYAGFGEVTWSATSKLDLTFGLRQFHFDYRATDFATGTVFGSSPWATVSASETNHVVKYRVSYKLSEDNLVYAQAAQGYRPGGPLGGYVSEDVTELKALGYGTPPTQYVSDKVWDYEVGSKNAFLDGKVTLNGDIYYINWQDIQIALNLPDGTQIISNAGNAVSKGAELEAALHPLTGLDLRASAAFTDATFSQTLADIETVAGGRVPDVPRWTYSFSPVYTHDLGGNVTGYARGDLTHVGSRTNDLPGAEAGTLIVESSYTTLNVRLGARFSGWETSFFVNNVTDVKGILNTVASFRTYEAFTTPRTIGVHVSKEL
jgi:iron complex outermembrane receptor protein